MVVLRNRSLSATKPLIPHPQTNKKTARVAVLKRDVDSDEDILECIVVRAPLAQQELKLHSESQTGARSSENGTKRRKILGSSPVAKSPPESKSPGSGSPESRNGASPLGTPPPELKGTSGPCLSESDRSPSGAPWDVQAASNYLGTPSSLYSETPTTIAHQHSDRGVNEVLTIASTRRQSTRRQSTRRLSTRKIDASITRKPSPKPHLMDINQEEYPANQVQVGSHSPISQEAQCPTTVYGFRGSRNGQTKRLIGALDDFITGSKTLTDNSNRMGPVYISRSKRILRDRGEEIDGLPDASMLCKRRAKKKHCENGSSDELLESITLKPVTVSVHEQSSYIEEGTGSTRVSPASTFVREPLYHAQRDPVQVPESLTSVLQSTVTADSSPKLPLDSLSCEERGASDSYVETLLLMSGLSSDVVDDMMSREHQCQTL